MRMYVVALMICIMINVSFRMFTLFFALLIHVSTQTRILPVYVLEWAEAAGGAVFTVPTFRSIPVLPGGTY